MLDEILVVCDSCKKVYEVDNWKHVRTMIEAVDGHSAFRYVYLFEKECICGSTFVVEAQGYEPPGEDIVHEWFYRYFDCEQLESTKVNLV